LTVTAGWLPPGAIENESVPGAEFEPHADVVNGFSPGTHVGVALNAIWSDWPGCSLLVPMIAFALIVPVPES
jgi:hypothetical protein